MKESRIAILVVTVLSILVPKTLALQERVPSQGRVGRIEPGAEQLVGYLLQDTPSIPIKKFALDAGFRSNVSPSRRGVAIIIGTRISTVMDLKLAIVDGKEFELSVPGIERDGDFFIPLEFYERLLPNTIKYDRNKRTVTISLSNRILTVPIKPLPAGTMNTSPTGRKP